MWDKACAPVVGDFGDFGHVGACRAPRVVAGRYHHRQCMRLIKVDATYHF